MFKMTEKEAPQQCIYCGAPAQTRDHIPPRSFLQRPFPEDLFTVPACEECNLGFSKDEEYFLLVLSLTSDAPALRAAVAPDGSVGRALQRAPGLAARIESQVVINSQGQQGVNPQHPRVNRVVAKIACGLEHKRGRQTLIEKFDVLSYPLRAPNSVPDEIRALGTSSQKWTVIQPGVFSYISLEDFKGWPGYLLDFYGTHWALAMITGGILKKRGMVPGIHQDEKGAA